MADHLLLLPTMFFFLCCHGCNGVPQDLAAHPGHLKPFGESGHLVDIPSVSDYLDTDQFLEDFVLDSKPLVFRGVAKRDPAIHLWTDSYLRKVAGEWVGKSRQVEHLGNVLVWLSMKEILDKINTSDVYVIEDVPRALLSDAHLPCPLQHLYLRRSIEYLNLWIASNGSFSLLHIDDADNMNCVYRGNKTFLLVERYKRHKMFDLVDNLYVDLDVNKVDLTKFPYLAGATIYRADLQPGDCLYIPYMWPHQARSFGSCLSVNMWWTHSNSLHFHDQHVGENYDLSCDRDLTLNNLDHSWERFEAPLYTDLASEQGYQEPAEQTETHEDHNHIEMPALQVQGSEFDPARDSGSTPARNEAKADTSSKEMKPVDSSKIEL